MRGVDPDLRTLSERVASIEERVDLIPEMRADIKALLGFMNQARGGGLVLVKLMALAGMVMGIVGIVVRFI